MKFRAIIYGFLEEESYYGTPISHLVPHQQVKIHANS